MRYSCRLLALVGLAILAAGCRGGESGPAAKGPSGGEQPTVAFITNQIADFWKIAEAGCLDAQKDFDVKVDVRMPIEATAVEQKRIVEDLLNSGVAGIAISPIDADNQKDLINSVAKKVPLITHDSDAPGTDRLMYVGMDNYRAGRLAGDLVKKALPDGGNIVIFIGRLEQDNSKHRRQGTIDSILDRPSDSSRFDPVEGKIEGEKYSILATLVDQGKQEVAKEKAADAINAYPEMNAMVGLFEYNPPACYQALQQANKLGEIKLIGFDENELTLQAIKDGTCVGTVVQNPYEYGYQSVKILAALIKGDKSVIPESKFIDIEARTISAENVDEFWADLKAKKGS